MKIDQDCFYQSLLKFKGREIPAKNMISDYLPYRNKGADFSYSHVAGRLISYLVQKKLPAKFTLEDLSTEVIKELQELTVEGELGELANDIYFTGSDGLNKLSPLFLILNTAKGVEKVSKSSDQLADLFCASISQNRCVVAEPTFNFIEAIVVEKYTDKLEDISTGELHALPYLPFLADSFQKDIAFLCAKPQFLLEKIEDFMGLYNFLYCTQLGANIRNWKSGEPEPVEHYFIIDTEKCSAERKASRSYKDLRQSVENIFPMLTLVHELNNTLGESIPSMPLWKVAEVMQLLSAEQQSSLSEALSDYAERFSNTPDIIENGRGLLPRERSAYSEGVIGDLELLVQYSMDQFDQSREYKSSSKHEMKSVKYLKPFEQEVAKHFVQARGRLGKVLVINQDYLLMLTNVVIGDNEEMRLQEILSEFELRGVYLDKRSQLSLIAFYERIGNIKRMSDSGDAIYVKSTI
jgi:DNA phosphorothioation-dependent restriction protein DptG